MNDTTPQRTPPKTLTEFCDLDNAALERYLEMKGDFLKRFDEKAESRISAALEKKLCWVA
jgi:hypothetical protein